MRQKPTVVICGSFHRDPVGLKKLFLELEANGCRVVSPLSIAFENTDDKFVKASTEQELSVSELERFHLRAIREADMIWIHAPDGYIGISGAFEVGYAYSLKKPIYSKDLPDDEMMRNFVQQAESVFEVLFSSSNAAI